MGDWTEHDPRNVTYPAAPQDPAGRREFMDRRNTRIGSHGAAKAVAASGASIGAPKDKSKEK